MVLRARVLWAGIPMTIVRRLAAAPAREICRLIVRAVPRRPGLVLLGTSLERFADNPAYLYLHGIAGGSELRFVWITGSRSTEARLRASSLPVARRTSLRGIWLSMRAGWYIYGSYPSDISRWLYDGARLLNLWHGVGGTKNLERLVTSGLTGVIHRRRPSWAPVAIGFRDDRRSPDYVLSTSPAMTERAFSPGFGVPAEHCLELGYPRVDHFFGDPAADATDLTPLVVDPARLRQVQAADFAIGYFPTWRDDGSDFLGRAGVSLAALAARIAEMGGTLVYKPHFITRSDVTSSVGLIVLDRYDDVNVYLRHCRALVTDYSSIASDFLLLDRPIVYFVPDFEAYRRQRQPLFQLDEVMAGAIVPTVDELLEAIRGVIDGEDSHAPARAKARALLWGQFQGGASRAILGFIQRVNAGSGAAGGSADQARG
ncbi:MAG: hypothetical protein QOJ32_2665 [Frankiaceae bacterium]|nr:hypothetical protein [Frankiaceae bacterium]